MFFQSKPLSVVKKYVLIYCFVLWSFFVAADVDIIDSDSDGDELTVFVAGKPIPLDDVNDEIIAQMTPQEKETYIQVYQEAYSHMYD